MNNNPLSDRAFVELPGRAVIEPPEAPRGPRESYALDETTGCDTPLEMGLRFMAECVCEAFARLQSNHITTTITSNEH